MALGAEWVKKKEAAARLGCFMCAYDVSLQFDVDVVFLGQAAEVDDGVAHAAEGGVDAYAGFSGYVFEVAFAVVAQDDHATLLGGEHFDQFADVLVGLLAYDFLFYVVVLELEGVNDVAVGLVGHDGHFVVAAEVVDNQVVGDTHDPVDEFVFIFVKVGVDGSDDFDEGILEDIVGDGLVLNNRENVSVNFCLIPRKEDFKAFVITVSVTQNQFVVGEFGNFWIHNFIIFD